MTGGGAGHWTTQRFGLAIFAVILLTVATRIPALIQRSAIDDEAVYSVVANEIVDGGRPYVDAIERKPPLLFWTYAAVFKVAGKFNWKALHAVALLWTLGTMAGLYLIGRELFNREVALIAALLYSIYQPWGTWKNLAFNGELLMNLPLVWAWALTFRKNSSWRRHELFLAGALVGASCLLKQPAGIAIVPLGLYLLLPGYRIRCNAGISHCALLIVGFIATLALVALLLASQGLLSDAFYWSVTNHSIPHVFWNRAAQQTLTFIVAALPLLLGAVWSLRDPSGLWAEMRVERRALLAWLVVSAIGVAAGARFYPHYYIQLIPPLALLAPPYLARLLSNDSKQGSRFSSGGIAKAWLVITVITFSVSHLLGFASHSDPSPAGRYLRQHSLPADRIFVWGQSPEVYLAARRRPASRYVTTFPLTGYIFGGPLPGIDTRGWVIPGAWATLEADFSKHPPIYIVNTEQSPGDRYPVKDFPTLATLLTEKYDLVTEAADGDVYRIKSDR